MLETEILAQSANDHFLPDGLDDWVGRTELRTGEPEEFAAFMDGIISSYQQSGEDIWTYALDNFQIPHDIKDAISWAYDELSAQLNQTKNLPESPMNRPC